jgi:hypothetical protein
MNPTVALLIRVCILVIVPVFPAFLLFKALPSKAIITGPLQGLNLNLSGAFGAYFALVLLLIGAHSVWDPPIGKVWSLDGTVMDENGNPMPTLETAQVKVDPAPIRIIGSGAFHVDFATTVGPTGDPIYPSLTIAGSNFLESPIPLDPVHPIENKDLKIEWDSNKQRIHITRIVMHKLPAYNESGPAPAPVNPPEHK